MYISFVLKNYVSISELDPFSLDEEFSKLPIYNQKKDIKALYKMLEKAKNSASNIDFDNILNCHAMVRDFGFIVSSLRKLGIQPTEVDNDLNILMLKLGNLIGMVPRDTSYHYGILNPIGTRQRVYTNFKDEFGLIDGVRIFAKGLERILLGLLDLKEIIVKKKLADTEFFLYILRDFKSILNDTGKAMGRIDPKTFSYELRPYFDPIVIGDESYVGPGGGQVPLILIDNFLFGFNLPKDHIYSVFSEEGVKYLTPELIELYTKLKREETIISLCNKNLDGSIIDFIKEFFNELIRYRKIHFAVAKNSLNESNKGNYETGSAGYKLDMVYQTLQATVDAKRIFLEKIMYNEY